VRTGRRFAEPPPNRGRKAQRSISLSTALLFVRGDWIFPLLELAWPAVPACRAARESIIAELLREGRDLLADWPRLVRGISDYADENKNDVSQPYASLAAAAYTRALIESMPATPAKVAIFTVVGLAEFSDDPLSAPDLSACSFGLPSEAIVSIRKIPRSAFVDRISSAPTKAIESTKPR
jgi:hypothetical protein